MSETLEIKTFKKRFKRFDVSNPYSLVSTARKGLSAGIFYELADAINMPEKELAGILNLSARTIGNYRDNRKALDPYYSEHLLKIIALYEKGEQVFGNINEFNKWLEKPFWSAKDKPVDWMNTPGGIDLLLKEIEKLAQGYPV